MTLSTESLLTRTYYHGSDKDLTVLKPIGVNMGHRWAKPEWAIYFWGSEAKARKWAVYQYCRRNTTCKMMYHIPTGGFAITENEFRKVLEAVLGNKTFCYSVTLPRSKVGYGSSPDIEEYTYNKEVVPECKEIITLTKEELRNSAVILSEQSYETYRNDLIAGKYSGGRGFLFRLIMDSERDRQRHKYHKLIASGKLAPGDDLEEITLESISFRW